MVHSFAIELTALCNQHCDYCYNEWREDSGKALGHAEPELLKQRVTRLLDHFEIDHVTLTGGEPLSHPSFFEIAELIQSRGVGIQVISNGGIITQRHAERMRPLGLRFVQITLNGADEALHAAHVGAGHFARTLRGIRTLKEHGVTVVGCIVVTKKNAHAVGEILALWKSLGVSHIALSRFSPAGYAARHVAALLPSVPDLERAFSLANAFGKEMTLQCTMPVPPCALDVARFENVRFGFCPIGTKQQEFVLGPDGKLRHCTLHGGALAGVQDIVDDAVDLDLVVGAPEVKAYRKDHPEFCTGCIHLDTCGGGCGAASVWVHGSRRGVDPIVSQHVDAAFSETLSFARKNGRTHLELIS